ncbi:hypothetical protein F4703DRAFT_1931923 [Phycomyces blakesleeanus]
MSPRLTEDSLSTREYGSSGPLSRDLLLTREQQLREEIARLKLEEQELREKDHWIKQNIMAVREKLAAERRIVMAQGHLMDN